MDSDELDHLEKRGHLLQPVRPNPKAFPPPQPQPPQYHSRFSGLGYLGISAYGWIILACLAFLGLVSFGVVHGLWHLCIHYGASRAHAVGTARQTQFMH